MQISNSSSKELALTTLVDLFVQILFIFVMILAVKANSTGADGGFEIEKPWQRLVEFLGLPIGDKNSAADFAIRRIKTLEKEKQELLDKFDQTPLSKPLDGRAPGKPRCKAEDRIVPPVVRLTMKAD